jgi:hypothetical protein
MHVIRVPYPTDPERRRATFERILAKLGRHGTLQGSPEVGSFRGSTPIGHFAGHYRSPDGSGMLEIELTEKPWLISASWIEREARRFLDTV